MASSSRSDAPPPYSEEQDAGIQPRGKQQQPVHGVYEPLLSGQYRAAHSDMPVNDIDDFEYGVSVAASSIQVRHAFILKLYSVLFAQLLLTVLVGATIFRTDNLRTYVQSHAYCFWIPMVLSIASMLALFLYKQQHPLNVYLLTAFTLCESIAIGTVVSYYSSSVVLLSLVICTFLVLGLTLFACQTRYDFLSMAAYLYHGLLVFLLVGLAAIFFPFSNQIQMLYSGLGVLLFSGLLLVDTQVILRRLSPEDWVLGVVSLYLDIINLFLNILNLVARSDDS